MARSILTRAKYLWNSNLRAKHSTLSRMEGERKRGEKMVAKLGPIIPPRTGLVRRVSCWRWIDSGWWWICRTCPCPRCWSPWRRRGRLSSSVTAALTPSAIPREMCLTMRCDVWWVVLRFLEETGLSLDLSFLFFLFFVSGADRWYSYGILLSPFYQLWREIDVGGRGR